MTHNISTLVVGLKKLYQKGLKGQSFITVLVCHHQKYCYWVCKASRNDVNPDYLEFIHYGVWKSAAKMPQEWFLNT